MNMKLLFVLSLSWVLVACTDRGVETSADVDVSAGLEKGLTCDEHEKPPAACTDVGHPPTINLNTISMKANPPNVCAKKGDTMTFKITPVQDDRKKGSVSITPKDPADTWLIGSNSSDAHTIEITIPTWVAKDEYYDYGFAVAGGKCVDPRVAVH